MLGCRPIGTVVHPVALYDFLLTTALFIVLIRFLRSPRALGSVIALFTLWYAGSRVFTDFLRTDPRRFAGLTGSQLTSIVLIVGVLTALRFVLDRGSSLLVEPTGLRLRRSPRACPSA